MLFNNNNSTSLFSLFRYLNHRLKLPKRTHITKKKGALDTLVSSHHGTGVCLFRLNFTECQILSSFSWVDFHTLTLQLPIQTQNSVAPELQVFVSSLEISAKRAHQWDP